MGACLSNVLFCGLWFVVCGLEIQQRSYTQLESDARARDRRTFLQASRPHRDRSRLHDDAPAVVAGVRSVAEDRGTQFEVAQGPFGCPRKPAHGIMLPRRPREPLQVRHRELHQVNAFQYACARADIVTSMASDRRRDFDAGQSPAAVPLLAITTTQRSCNFEKRENTILIGASAAAV